MKNNLIFDTLLKLTAINLNKVFYKQKVNVIFLMRKIGLWNYNFTIISNNCWGGFVYNYFKLKYQTPFVGLFLFAPCYIKFLENFDSYINSDLVFIKANESKYKNNIETQEYPIALLDNEVEIHFLHYTSEIMAKKNWKKRSSRINKTNMLVKFSDRDLCTKELIERFDNLPFNNKICFTTKKYPLKSVIFFNEQIQNDMVENEWGVYRKYMNIKKTLNNLKRIHK
ncbi:DUF1919 domain-containing protein [Larkinella punicea]|uniref:DUF1919 domain-containing protein n=1 Tax=Larkinella punicea TaxID=2315727 RepID=A0A368JKQ0_9BACT|nr:DUF1919 domain-containing protein [Larkinella punicea]RCR67626.1 DUF1919 domain-containing protein [Larkinella punicea]